MAGKTKIVPTLYLPYDYDREEAYINSMSDKGWQLIKGGLFHHTYLRDDEKYRYKLDYNNQVNYNKDEYYRYISIFSEQGWDKVNSTINGWHYFRKKYDAKLPDDDYELYSDDSSLLEMLSRFRKLARAIQLVLMFLLLISVIIMIFTHDLTALPDVILFILGIALMEMSIFHLNKKKVTSKQQYPALGYKAGYLILGIFFLWFIFSMMYYIFFI
jgi:hypothetical protein